MKERVSGEGRKEQEKVHTRFEDTREEERGEEETGREEEARLGQHDKVSNKHSPTPDNNKYEPRDIKGHPNEVVRRPDNQNSLPTASPTTQAALPHLPTTTTHTCRPQHVPPQWNHITVPT